MCLSLGAEENHYRFHSASLRLPSLGQTFDLIPLHKALPRWFSSQAEADIADDGFSESFLEFCEDVALPCAVELVADARLDDLHSENSSAQSHRQGVEGKKFPDHLPPRCGDLLFAEPFTEPELRHHFL